MSKERHKTSLDEANYAGFLGNVPGNGEDGQHRQFPEPLVQPAEAPRSQTAPTSEQLAVGSLGCNWVCHQPFHFQAQVKGG